jgi:hypothetical protein
MSAERDRAGGAPSLTRRLVPLAVGALLLTAARVPAQGSTIPPQIVLDNGVIAAEFDTSGTSLDLSRLRALVNLPPLAPIQMAPGSGGWTVRLVVGDSGAADWFEFSMDGSTAESAPGTGSLISLSLDELLVFEPPEGLIADWSGEVSVAGQGTPFTVTSTWMLVPGEPYLDTTIRVTLDPDLPLPYYVSQVAHPELKVASFSAPTETLVAPWIGGNLVVDPTNPGNPFPSLLDQSTYFFFPVNVSGFYDGRTPSSCFFLTATDADDHLKELLIGVDEGDLGSTGDTSPPHVSFAMRHVPEDIFANRDVQMPYAVRLGAVVGDWWAVVEHQRRLLRDEIPWYQGPVGSPSHPMPQAAKQLVAELLFQPGYHGDHLDMLSRQAMNMTRVLGPHVNVYLYGAHAPDTFDHWYLEDGYLPGRPSFVGAVREAQKQFQHVVSPYVNGSLGADWTDPALDPPITDPSQLMLDVEASFLIDEDGQPHHFYGPHGPPRAGFLCPGATWWQSFFPQNIREIAAFTDMRGAYLDYFLTGPCFSTEHLHAPGGGNWMNVTRMQQLRDTHLAPFDELVVPMEFVFGRFTEEIHTMHVDPANNLLSAEDHPGSQPPLPKPMDNAVTIPLFRAIHDNVKLGRIPGPLPSDAGRRAWMEANATLTFGQIPGLTRAIPELIPIFSQRFAFAPTWGFLGNNEVDPGNLGASAPSNDVGFPDNFVPQKQALNVPYLRFLSDLTAVLRDHGFLTWHNGTIRKLPLFDISLVGPPGFDGVPGVELDPDDGLQTNTPVYVEEWLVPGMFQAPDDLGTPDSGSLAFVAANPWVDPVEQGIFDLDFALVPGQYPGWTNTTPYTVTVYDQDGDVTALPGPFSGPFVLSNVSGLERIEAGEIVWWVFRKVTTP